MPYFILDYLLNAYIIKCYIIGLGINSKKIHVFTYNILGTISIKGTCRHQVKSSQEIFWKEY